MSAELTVGHPDVTASRTEEVLQPSEPRNNFSFSLVFDSALPVTVTFCLDLFLTAWLPSGGQYTMTMTSTYAVQSQTKVVTTKCFI